MKSVLVLISLNKRRDCKWQYWLQCRAASQFDPANLSLFSACKWIKLIAASLELAGDPCNRNFEAEGPF